MCVCVCVCVCVECILCLDSQLHLFVFLLQSIAPFTTFLPPQFFSILPLDEKITRSSFFFTLMRWCYKNVVLFTDVSNSRKSLLLQQLRPKMLFWGLIPSTQCKIDYYAICHASLQLGLRSGCGERLFFFPFVPFKGNSQDWGRDVDSRVLFNLFLVAEPLTHFLYFGRT